MGRPRHYSGEVPLRCQALIDMLIQRVDEESDPDGRWGGPLKTTFLLAMATPMLVLPMERLFKPARPNHRGVADDRELDPHLAKLVVADLGPGKAFGAAPFFELDTWAYVPAIDPFDVARDWPRRALDPLAGQRALQAASEAPARDVLLALRNALGHGGVTYLDRDGQHADFATNMLGFAAFARHGAPELRLLRVSVRGFQDFLGRWANWLSASGVLNQLDERGPGYFEFAAE
jgi:hypothetical protein